MRWFLLACAWLMTLPMAADAWDGNQLYKACQTGGASIACVAYVAGVMDRGVIDAATAKNFIRVYAKRFPGIPEDPRNFLKTMSCRGDIPASVTYGQAADIVARYLHDYPEEREKDGSDVVDRALNASFPCVDPLKH
jgi:hypothetical protein